MKRHLELINELVKLKKKKNPYYSNNAIARDLGVSSAFFSALITGKKDFPVKTLSLLFNILEVDDFTRMEILKSLLRRKYKESVFQEAIENLAPIDLESFLPAIHYSSLVLEKWYFLAILEFLSCKNYQPNFEYIAARFSVSTLDVEETMLILESEGLVKKDEQGKFQKVKQYTRVPTTKSKITIRNFHEQMINKSVEHLKSKTDEVSFTNRLITGLTISANLSNLEKCKSILEEALHNSGMTLSDGDCTEVYQINIQLFPLSLSEKGENSSCS